MIFTASDVTLSKNIDIIIDDGPIAKMISRLEDNGVTWTIMPRNLTHDPSSTKGYGWMGSVVVSNSRLEMARAYLVGR